MIIRLAEAKDINQLIKMTWDFTIEYDESKRNASYVQFEKECQAFLEGALNRACSISTHFYQVRFNE